MLYTVVHSANERLGIFDYPIEIGRLHGGSKSTLKVTCLFSSEFTTRNVFKMFITKRLHPPRPATWLRTATVPEYFSISGNAEQVI
jgi:hypothetical protein